MRKNSFKLALLKTGKAVLLSLFIALYSFTAVYGNSPVFSEVVYQGNDQVYKDFPLNPDEFYNPILQGCYPDPSITCKGDDYYIVCSSFAMFPGVPIFHSKDLVNWKQIGHVLDRTSQLKVEDCGISAGVYAPQIIYNPFNETFYMITTQFSGGFGNIVVKTKDPFQGWSDPVKLDFNGIDPSLFFDDNGKAYIIHNDAPDKGKELYNGHRVIKIWEYDVANDKIIQGTDLIIVDGGVDLSQKPIWIEAPHIYKKDGLYYLMCAEGGTGGWHSEVIFVSSSPKGPYKPAPGNPILTQRYFSKDRTNKVDWAGHADLVKGPDDKYYGVFLAIRPNQKDRVNIGRETFILPVDWSGTFPVFENGLIPLSPKLKMPKGITENKTGKEGFFPNGNFTFAENFTSEKLDYRWIGLRGPRENFISVTKKGLQITPFLTNIKEVKPTSTLFLRQQHNNFSFTATIDYMPASEKDLAGIVCLQSEKFNYVFGITKKADAFYLVLQRTDKGQSKIIASTRIDIKSPIRLQVKAEGENYNFDYSTNGTDFVNLGGAVSGDILSTNVAGGFTGSLIGLYATSANDIQPEFGIAQQPAPVKVSDGLVQGTFENGLTVYKGIPFAAPPVGDLRWRAPQPPAKWNGVKQATKFAPAPMQGGNPPSGKSEDCLYLNVWTPAQSSKEKIPVLVWIYGGGFSFGSTSEPGYSGEKLAKKGVVLVSIAYRVGQLAFLAHPELSAESPNHVSGNYGLLDMIAGLQWIQKNIAAFGGDPNKVTIFGESAGGISVSMLCASPLAKGLFQGAISQSGGSFGPTRPTTYPGENMKTLKQAEADGIAFAKKTGVSTVADLRKIEADKLPGGFGLGSGWPIVDEYVIPDDQYKLYEAGKYNDVPVLIGYNSDEGASFSREKTPEEFITGVKARYGKFADDLIKAYPVGTATVPKTARDLARDAAFGWQTWIWARLQSQTGKSKVFYYYFDQHPEYPEDSPRFGYGSPHGQDVAYVFQHLNESDPQTTKSDLEISDAMSTYWTNFARYGNPNGEGVPVWPAFSDSNPEVMYFGPTPHTGPVPDAESLKVLDAYFMWRRTPEGAAWAK